MAEQSSINSSADAQDRNSYKLIAFYTMDNNECEKSEAFLKEHSLNFMWKNDRYIALFDSSVDDSWLSKNIQVIRMLFRAVQWSNDIDIISDLITL